MSDRAQMRQLIGSLVVAAILVVVAIVVVTAKLGPTSTAELDAREERQKQRIELIEERQEARVERLEQQARDGE